MVPWQAIPITALLSAWASVIIAFTAYAIVKIGADSELPMPEGDERR